MILQKTSPEFRRFFILQLTRQLIKNSIDKEVFEIESAVQQPDEPLKGEAERSVNKLKDKIKDKLSHLKEKKINLGPPERIGSRGAQIPSLPPVLSTRPARKDLLDLGEKLNPIINDPLIHAIECYGSNKQIIARNAITITTQITLNSSEIDEVIHKFLRVAKIPMKEDGIMRVSVGRLTLTAIISNAISSKFIIEKSRR